MLLVLKSIKNKGLRRVLEHSIYIAIILVLIPAYLYFELCIVLPAVEEQWSLAFFVHIGCASFLLMNIVGNMIYGIFTNTTIKGRNLEVYNKDNWSLCVVCECLRPPRSWHCNTCDICILKRDHHCTFFTCCVGYYNHRYFMLFTLYMFIAMVYSLYYNIKFISMIFTFNYFLVVKFVFPLVSFMFDRDEGVYILLIVVNVVVACFSGFLFLYHLNNILRGRVVYESNTYTNDFIYNMGWKLNLVEVFGNRWYLTWISPFINSKLPGNGIEWPTETKRE